jgi:hypothetical protein
MVWLPVTGPRVVSLAIFLGCGVKQIVLEPQSATPQFENGDVYPLSVRLDLTEAFRNSHLVGLDGFNLEVGETLARDAEALARALFEVVVVDRQGSGASVSENPIDVVLVPYTVSIEETRPILGYKDSTLQIVVLWRLTGAGGQLIWQDTIKVRATSTVGKGWEGPLGGSKHRFGMAIPDVFEKSFKSMSSARTIRRFVEERPQG